MTKNQKLLCSIIEAEHGSIVSVAGLTANVTFTNGRHARIPLKEGNSIDRRWLQNFRRDVRTRRDQPQGQPQ